MMNMQDVRTIAKQHLIDVTGLSRIELVHKLQRQEGSFDYFATAYDGECDQIECIGARTESRYSGLDVAD